MLREILQGSGSTDFDAHGEQFVALFHAGANNVDSEYRLAVVFRKSQG